MYSLKQKTIIFIIIILAVFAYLYYDQINRNQTDQNINLYIGKNAFYAQQYLLAQEYFVKDLIQNPNRPETLYMLAQSFMKGKYQNFNKSIEYYKLYLAQFQETSPLSLKLIQQMITVGMIEELKILSSKSNNELFKATIWENLDSEKALSHLILVPDELQDIHYYLLATRIYSIHQMYQEAIINASKANELNGLHKNNYYLLSQAYRNLKEFEMSKNSLKTYELMNLLDNETNAETQLIHLNNILKLNSGLLLSDDFKGLYITLLIKTKQYSEARQMLNTVNQAALSHQIKISILSAINNLKAHDLAIAMYHKSKNEFTLDDYVLYCQLGLQINNPNDLFNECEQASKTFPHSAPILYWHGVSLLKINKNERAQKQIQSAIDHAPWMNPWIIHLAELYLIEGKVELAKNVLNQSINNSDKIQQFKMSNSLF